MELKPGTKLGPYEILSPIGAGGMGEVWKARDTRLDRTVAIKTSKVEFSGRFEQEARAVAALNHPHICILYDVGPDYLVMELIDGVPLKGPLPLEKAIEYAGQILEALDAAHRKGITHRDLKPANILVTKKGIKLLDFGLAKQAAGLGPDDVTRAALTMQGQIAGTLQYMAPEQLQAKEADSRADIFAFGCVLYEMLTGRRAFDGENAASIIAAVMERPAPSVAEVAPAALDRVLKKCLAKDPDDRWQSARDLRDELVWIAGGGSKGVTTAPSQSRLGKTAWVAVAAVMVVALGVALWAPWRSQKPVDRPLVRLDVDLGADVSLPPPNIGGSDVAISPDGTRLAYFSGTPTKLFTRRLDQPKAKDLPGTEGARLPFFSPDGQWVGFIAGTKLNKISVDGGAVAPLGDVANFAGASWGENGSIVAGDAVGKGLIRFPTSSGPPETIAPLGSGELALDHPQILPGGKAILFAAVNSMDVDKNTVEVLTLADSHRKIVARGGSSPRYLATSSGAGHLVYLNKATLFAVPFDLEMLETRGSAVPVLDDVSYASVTGAGQLDFSRMGTLVYRRASGGASGMTTLQWVYPSNGSTGKKEPLPAKPGAYDGPTLSPDGKLVALTVKDGGSTDIWVYDPRRDAMTRLTFGGGADIVPLWSADGQYVVFTSIGSGIFQVRADGAGQPRALTQSKATQVPSSFAPDGKRMAYSEYAGNGQLWTLPLEDQGGQLKAGKPEQFLKSGFNDINPSFSPDGRWLAYQSNESGKYEVYVRAFPPPPSGQGGKWQVSNNGGNVPVWSRSGQDLMYQSGDRIMAVSYTAKGDTFVPDKPRVWIAKLGGTEWDLAPDGKRVLVLTPVESAEPPKQEHEIVMLQNFFDELRRRVPVGK